MRVKIRLMVVVRHDVCFAELSPGAASFRIVVLPHICFGKGIFNFIFFAVSILAAFLFSRSLCLEGKDLPFWPFTDSTYCCHALTCEDWCLLVLASLSRLFSHCFSLQILSPTKCDHLQLLLSFAVFLDTPQLCLSVFP